MNTRTIQNNQLQAGTQIFVEGITQYSRLAKFIDGDELQKDIANKKTRNMTPIMKPYTTITIANAKIRPKDSTALTLEELYVQERFYTKQSTQLGNTLAYTIDNKSQYLPKVSQFNAATNEAVQVDLKGRELDTGLHVILCLSVYQPKNFANKGISLDNIIVMDPIRHYMSANHNLNALGLTYKPLPNEPIQNIVPQQNTQNLTPAMAAPAPAMQPTVAQNQTIPSPMNATPVGGTPQIPQSVPQPVPQTQNTPLSDVPQNAQPVTGSQNPMGNAMNPPTMGDPATPWICPACGQTNMSTQKFCGTCGGPQTNNTVVNNPYAQQVTPAQPQTGIVYEPNPTNRNY